MCWIINNNCQTVYLLWQTTFLETAASNARWGNFVKIQFLWNWLWKLFLLYYGILNHHWVWDNWKCLSVTIIWHQRTSSALISDNIQWEGNIMFCLCWHWWPWHTGHTGHTTAPWSPLVTLNTWGLALNTSNIVFITKQLRNSCYQGSKD